MTTVTAFLALLRSNLRAWASARGFWLVVVAALLPLLLVGAWVMTHRDDIAVTGLDVGRSEYVEGDAARFVAFVENTGATSVGAFNVTLAVGEVEADRLFPVASEDTTIEGLAPGERREVALNWTASPGVLYVLASADVVDVVTEVDEYNNLNATPIFVRRAANESARPVASPALGGDANATGAVDLSVSNFVAPEQLKPGENATFTMDVTNNGPDAAEGANVTLRVARSVGGRAVAVVEQREPMTLAPGETKTVTLRWSAQEGSFWLEGFAQAPTGARDADTANNQRADPLLVDADFDAPTPPAPPEKLTIKEFYFNVILRTYLQLLLPLIALYYAAGVISDAEEQGFLPYLLTRPVPRWVIPVTRFLAGLVVSAIALLIGLTLAYVLLFSTTPGGKDVGFFTTPLLVGLMALAAYGAVFLLFGVTLRRPYLAGLLFVLGWETIAARVQVQTASGSRALAEFFVPWVSNLTVIQHLNNAFAGWALDEGLQWAPTGEGAGRAALVVLGIIVVALGLTAARMRAREF